MWLFQPNVAGVLGVGLGMVSETAQRRDWGRAGARRASSLSRGDSVHLALPGPGGEGREGGRSSPESCSSLPQQVQQ